MTTSQPPSNTDKQPPAVVLHVGAHRTATNSLQHYLRHNESAFSECAISIWEPRTTRDGGLLTGVYPTREGVGVGAEFEAAKAKIKTSCEMAHQHNIETILISDENIIGAPRANLKKANLYPDVGPRMRSIIAGFDGRVSRIGITIRDLTDYWRSTLTFARHRAGIMPDSSSRAEIAQSQRGWREVLTDMAAAAPGVPVEVFLFDDVKGRPDAQLQYLLRCPDLPKEHAEIWSHRVSDDDETLFFTASQIEMMKQKYQNDMQWLRSGADGIATLVNKPLA